MFSRKDLWKLLIPLMIEQLLNALMGTADTMMVSNIGSAAISAVSLVDSINILIVNMFSALATGGAIVCSQYVGRCEPKKAEEAGRQLLLSVFGLSLLITFSCVAFRAPLLHLIFGAVEADVMKNALTYMLLTVLSYPFIATYNASAALFRAGGNSRLPMVVSMISNGLNIAGNALFIFVFHMGVAGAAFSTLLSRMLNAAVILYFQRNPRQPIAIRNYLSFRPHFKMIGTILAIGIPSGIENGMFQFGKLAIQSTVSSLGTTSIAANAMAAVIESFTSMAAIGIGLGMITVVGQCVGAGRMDEARKYIIKLSLYGEAAIFTSSMIMLLLTRPITLLGGMEPAAAGLCFQMSLAINLYKPAAWAFSFLPAYGMRAAGDVTFSMITSTITMWICRVSLTILMIRIFHLGAMSVWYGMFTDWTVRGVIFTWRYRSGRWATKKVIHDDSAH